MVVDIDGVQLHLAHPDELNVTWVGQEDVMRQLLAAWLVLDTADLPMNPRLLGKPGVGKTTLAYTAGKRLGRDVYILQATVDPKTQRIVLPPDCTEAYQKYLALAPTGPYAGEVKGILDQAGEKINSNYKAPKK